MKSLKNLADIQRSFAQMVKSGKNTNELLQFAKEQPPLSGAQRMEIYQDGYRLRLMDSLKEDFLRVEKMLSEDEFEELILQYIQAYPSRHSSIAEHGQNFADFLLKKSSVAIYEAAFVDWLEIQSQYHASPRAEAVVSVTEIQNGVGFRIRKYSASCMGVTQSSAGAKTFLVYQYLDSEHGETRVCELQKNEALLLQYLEQPRTLDEVFEKCLQYNIEQQKIESSLAFWMKENITYCERP